MEHSREMQFMDIWLPEILMPEKIVNRLFRLEFQVHNVKYIHQLNELMVKEHSVGYTATRRKVDTEKSLFLGFRSVDSNLLQMLSDHKGMRNLP